MNDMYRKNKSNKQPKCESNNPIQQFVLKKESTWVYNETKG